MSGRRRVLSSADILAAHKDYMSGEPYSTLAARFECAENTLVNGFRRLGLPLHGPRQRGRGPRKAGVQKVGEYAQYGLYLQELLRMAER